MKKLLIILLSLGLVSGVSAQKIGSRGQHIGKINKIERRPVKPHVTVIAPVYPYAYGRGMGYGFGYRYSPFYDPFYSPRVVHERPTQLDLQIEDIKNEYDYRIDTAKDDKSLTKDQRKQLVRDLKHEREDKIIEAKKIYYGAEDNSNS